MTLYFNMWVGGSGADANIWIERAGHTCVNGPVKLHPMDHVYLFPPWRGYALWAQVWVDESSIQDFKLLQDEG